MLNFSFARFSVFASVFFHSNPVAFAVPSQLEIRQAPSVVSRLADINDIKSIEAILSNATGVSTESAKGSGGGDYLNQILNVLLGMKHGQPPSSIEQGLEFLGQVIQATLPSLFQIAAALIAMGFSPLDILKEVREITGGCNNFFNNNPRNPATPIFPKKIPEDAPYDILEHTLKQAILIPPEFTYGQKPPVILVPGTMATGCTSYGPTYIELLKGKDFADPVWINLPDFMLGDVQEHAEHVAYAINYISGISNNANVSVIGWSQGTLATQWALKYWPSTNRIVSDFIAFSGDYHGTTLTAVTCPGGPAATCTDAIIQQGDHSNLVGRLAQTDGNSAYVPTTNVFAATDQVIQPQSGAAASGRLNDARGVGVLNAEVNVICPPPAPAGTNVTHEGVLYNALGWALAVDALTHAGPADLSRIDVPTTCLTPIAPGLGLDAVLLTEAFVIVDVIILILYQPKTTVEPPIKPYATY